MGYTHYFDTVKLDEATWAAFTDAVKKVFATDALSSPPVLRREYDEDKPPYVSAELIMFNGVSEDEGHDTFWLPNAADSLFCKTARKPYDIAAVAVLCLYWHFAGKLSGVDIRSDGVRADWENGLTLAKIATGLKSLKFPRGIKVRHG